MLNFHVTLNAHHTRMGSTQVCGKVLRTGLIVMSLSNICQMTTLCVFAIVFYCPAI